MNFNLSKRALLEMKRGNVVQRERILTPNAERMNCVKEGKRFKYLGLWEVDEVKYANERINI